MSHHPPPDRLLNWRAVQALVGLSRSTVTRMGSDFPAAVRVSPGRVAWHQTDIIAWVSSRPDTRGQA
ncbi:AlpA family phage regulatory protein [Brevundimonas sp. Root1423]|uniref:helix-turn-helix transcriptional regulator n=1 Tax=Brevundimonas sp. Root1423 TaxID=1736462 RepID=UPI00138F2F09